MPTEPLPPPPRIVSRESFADAIGWGFDSAIADGARCITCVDPDFELWPLDDPGLLTRLTAWLGLPQRRLWLLAARYDDVPRRLPRFTTWRRDWAHAVQPMQCPQEFAADLPSVLVDEHAVSVQLIDAVHWRGRADRDVRTRLLWQERIDVVLQRSEPAFAVNTLGL